MNLLTTHEADRLINVLNKDDNKLYQVCINTVDGTGVTKRCNFYVKATTISDAEAKTNELLLSRGIIAKGEMMKPIVIKIESAGLMLQ